MRRILYIFCFIYAVATSQVPFIIQSLSGDTYKYSCLCQRYTDKDRLEWKPDPNFRYTIIPRNDTRGFIYTVIEVYLTNVGTDHFPQPPRCILVTPYYVKEIKP
ncbi:putative alpha chemokine ligand [Elephant endotheliotropic herpesvirus 5B]|nr:putative alpha chemokine ligand [Elephant endotheliotropic herpesvirus 5B]UVZ35284.1 putative alpha chemokine ligand [Elephant endotheliotropic herpesvirus 5B]